VQDLHFAEKSFRWPLFVIVLAVAISQVYFYHFFSDVVAGLLLGLAVSSLILKYAAGWEYVRSMSRRKIAWDP
jgi:membrane-associated phospholipid phosphatase